MLLLSETSVDPDLSPAAGVSRARELTRLRTGLSRKDCEPATAVREPVATIASPVAKNASPGTAPVAANASPKGPPFASRSADVRKPLQVGGERRHVLG